MDVLFILSGTAQLSKSVAMNFLQYVGIGAGGLVATAAAVDYVLPWLKYDLYYIRKLVSAKRMLDAFESSNSLFIDVFEKRCREMPQKTFLIFKVFQQVERLIYHDMFETCTKIRGLLFFNAVVHRLPSLVITRSATPLPGWDILREGKILQILAFSRITAFLYGPPGEILLFYH